MFFITLNTGTKTSSLTKGCNCPVNAAQSSGTFISCLLVFLELLCARNADWARSWNPNVKKAIKSEECLWNVEIKLISQTAKSTKTPSKLVHDSKAADMQTHSKAII